MNTDSIFKHLILTGPPATAGTSAMAQQPVEEVVVTSRQGILETGFTACRASANVAAVN